MHILTTALFSLGGQDCRQSQNCHPDASCDYDSEEGGYACLCNQGYVGNGLVCRPLHDGRFISYLNFMNYIWAIWTFKNSSRQG